MLTGFQITPEGVVFVRNGGDIYRASIADFTLDNGSAPPALPVGVTEQVYEPGKRNAYLINNSVVGGGDLQWAWGDDVMSRCAALLTAQTAREAANAPPPPPPPDVGTVPPIIVASALEVIVSNGDIPSMTGVFNVGAAIYLGVGNYMLFFIAPLSDANYYPVLQDGAHTFTVVDQQAEYITVQASDNGAPVDVPRFSLQVFKF